MTKTLKEMLEEIRREREEKTAENQVSSTMNKRLNAALAAGEEHKKRSQEILEEEVSVPVPDKKEVSATKEATTPELLLGIYNAAWNMELGPKKIWVNLVLWFFTFLQVAAFFSNPLGGAILFPFTIIFFWVVVNVPSWIAAGLTFRGPNNGGKSI